MRAILKIMGSTFLGVTLVFPITKSTQEVNINSTRPKYELVPDFCQRDTRFGHFPFDGKIQCGPVAASNLLMYLNNTNFPGLMSKENPGPYDQFELINLLSSDRYMKTKKELGGTTPYNLMQGLKQYLKDNGYGADIQYIGYQVDDHDKNQNLTGGGNITPMMIKDKSDEGFECIVRVGYYKDGVRVDGHYGTLVGFKEGNLYKVLIHDSSGGSGLEKKTDVWELISDKNKKGYWQVSGVTNAYPEEVVYLDGAIFFKVKK